ncbi:MAG TPA: MFS transporter [Acetobacteraceae bacterium]|nr:MFS transporter [Acetobacteraceae bacterium]
MPAWVAALSATLLMQAVASFLTQSLPVLAPLITHSAGLAPESIGNLSSLTAFGTVVFLLLGGPFLARLGPVRMLQAGAVMGAVAMALAGLGTLSALILASFALGIGYGPCPPAGSRILAATAPKGHRTLIFSVKQAGAPLGGALAGLIAAPIAAFAGWPMALLVAILLAIISAAIIQPLRETLDAERDPRRAINPGAVLSPATLASPIAALRADRLLPPLTLLSISFAVVQGCLFTFTVTWLVETRHFSIVQAGTAFAAMQAAGVVARIILGWLADRTGHATVNLLLQAFVASAVVLALALLPQGASASLVIALCAASGFLAASWNGISMAEVARVSPPDRVGEVTAGTTLFIFLGYMVAPSAFALLVSLSGGWTVPMVATAVQLGVVAALVSLALRRAARLRARGGAP